MLSEEQFRNSLSYIKITAEGIHEFEEKTSNIRKVQTICNRLKSPLMDLSALFLVLAADSYMRKGKLEDNIDRQQVELVKHNEMLCSTQVSRVPQLDVYMKEIRNKKDNELKQSFKQHTAVSMMFNGLLSLSVVCAGAGLLSYGASAKLEKKLERKKEDWCWEVYKNSHTKH